MRINSAAVARHLGSLLWTAGLLMVAHMLVLAVIHNAPVVMPDGKPFGYRVRCDLMVAGLLAYKAPCPLLINCVRDCRRTRRPRQPGGGDYPVELQPLINDLNTLMEHRERVVKRALANRRRSFAHGLKTPLPYWRRKRNAPKQREQVELGAADHAADRTDAPPSEYHLAHARAAASGATPWRSLFGAGFRRGIVPLRCCGCTPIAVSKLC